jgi:hypothetical protein
MPRKRISRSLPPLPKTHRLDDALHKTDRLIEILRCVAIKNQSAQPQAFYSVRNIAQHFRVTLSTAARAYHHLEREGLLTRVRGSKTLLQGTHFDRRTGVRAFVGLPASLSAFITLQPYRLFFIKIRRELRLRGFATAMVFTDKKEIMNGVLSKRLKAYEIDTVLWFQPPRDARDAAARLADLGLRLVGIAHEQSPPIPCRYEIRRDNAIRTLLTQWKERHAIEELTLVRLKDHRLTPLEETLENTLDELGIESSTVWFQDQPSASFLNSLRKTDTPAIVFSSARLVSKFCFRAPAAVADLLRIHRVAFLNGPVSMPFAKIPDVRVDLTLVDWQLAAEQIVDDLISQDAFQLPGPTIFEAEAKLRVPFSEFAQEI